MLPPVWERSRGLLSLTSEKASDTVAVPMRRVSPAKKSRPQSFSLSAAISSGPSRALAPDQFSVGSQQMAMEDGKKKTSLDVLIMPFRVIGLGYIGKAFSASIVNIVSLHVALTDSLIFAMHSSPHILTGTVRFIGCRSKNVLKSIVKSVSAPANALTGAISSVWEGVTDSEAKKQRDSSKERKREASEADEEHEGESFAKLRNLVSATVESVRKASVYSVYENNE
jgi:hypothetical protein